MTIFDVLTMVFGLSLFLFGMNLMGDTLKKSAGRGLKNILGRLTANPFMGFLLGLLVTAIIQSSSATTVMVVGFVNSGTMLLSQAVSVIIGANVGTVVTSWITALSGLEGGAAVGSFMQWLKPSTFTPIIALIGVLLYMVGKNDRKKNVGLILLGFSVLMIGMDTMSEAVAGLSENEAFRSILLMFEHPILGLLAGLILTAIIQSSSASIGILQSFTSTGAITFGNAVPIIMGQNIGTCVTALLSAAGTNKNAKRTAVVHLLFNVFGSILCMGAFYLCKSVFAWNFLNGSIDMWGIAIVHTLFNLLSAAVMLPLSKGLERLAMKLVRDRKQETEENLLDERLLATPSVAIERSRELTVRMARASMDALRGARGLLSEYSSKGVQTVNEREAAVDEYEDKLGSYLVRVSEQGLMEGESRMVNRLLHTLSDLERISDHAVNLSEAAEEIHEKKIVFSRDAMEELTLLSDAVGEIADLALSALEKDDLASAEQVEPLEQVINALRSEIKARHILRLQRGSCSIEQGFVLNDILTDMERVADHCSNLAAYLLDSARTGQVDLHRYLKEYRHSGSVFEERKQAYAQKYRLREIASEDRA